VIEIQLTLDLNQKITNQHENYYLFWCLHVKERTKKEVWFSSTSSGNQTPGRVLPSRTARTNAAAEYPTDLIFPMKLLKKYSNT
jgi:hypothetical protein